MRLPLVILGVVVIGSSACASRYRWPAAVYWVDLKQPAVIKLANGGEVPCGRGFAMAVHDRLLSCSIARRAIIQRREFPAGAALQFRWDGTLEEASYVERHGTLAHGEGFRDTRVMSFDPSGAVTRSTIERRQGTTSAPVPRDAGPPG